MRIGLISFAAAGVALAAVPAAASAQSRVLRVVQANVGNSNVAGCQDQVFKLCLRPVEERAARALRELRPDLVAFQEILPTGFCSQAPSSNPFNLCSEPLDPPSQVARLLGPGYAEVCDDRFGWDCIATRAGQVEPAELATRPVVDGCTDTGFTLSAGTVKVAGWPISVTNGHPDSTEAPCRAEQLRDLFESGLPARGPAIVLGDFNLDPYREDDASVRYWRTQVPGRFRYASTDAISFALGPSQLDPTGQATDGDAALVSRRTLDHVLTRDGTTGACEPRRIDGGGGMDHLAQVCRIEVGAEAAPSFRLRRSGCRVTAGFGPSPPHLLGVRFELGSVRRVDRRPPYRMTAPSVARARPVRATPLLTTGTGPQRRTTVRARCAGTAQAAPRLTG